MDFTFQTVDVKTELQARLKAALPNLGYTGANAVVVLKADPQSPSEIPCIGVNRIDDSESAQSIADSAGTLYDKDTQKLNSFYGTFFQEAVEVRVWHTNADERDKLYQAVKATMFAARPDFVQKGLLNITLRGGRDEQDSTMAHAPFVIYWATITMSYLNPLDVNFVSDQGAILSIAGTY